MTMVFSIADAADQPVRRGVKAVADRPRRVLVAEDEHLVAASLCDDLKELGYDVLGPAPNGRIAVEMAQRERPDLVLLDVRMPVMDGLEAGRRIEASLDAPVVIISAHSDRELVSESVRLGAVGYLLKPVRRDDLRVALELAWGQHHQRRKLRDEVDDLARKLEDRKVIERAKGLLMQTQGLTEPDAMRRLQKQARDSRRSLADVSRTLIESHTAPP